MYDKRQRGIQQALGQVGMNANRENPYSPFGGNVPAQTLQTLNDGMRGANTMQEPVQPPQQGGLRQLGIPQAQPYAPAPQLPSQQPPMPMPQPTPRQGRYPRPAQGPSQSSLQAVLRSPQFLERLRRRKAMRQAQQNPFNRSY